MLLGFGLDEQELVVCAKTGYVVDIRGTGDGDAAEKDADTVHSIALRCDLDGLPIPENNQDLEYKTQTKFAHMCGHDGHIATLLAAAKALHENRHKIPRGKFVRLLF